MGGCEVSTLVNLRLDGLKNSGKVTYLANSDVTKLSI